ncbi:hypothetical protein GCM10009675_21940 [Prauserella alba]|uniref:Uncharacterized protein n=1 Tax=Prauserella alba TaxID=176898 RepID=A0ABP4FYH5_9PSEU
MGRKRTPAILRTGHRRGRHGQPRCAGIEAGAPAVRKPDSRGRPRIPLAPGIRNTGPGIRNTSPGSRNTGPGIRNTRVGRAGRWISGSSPRPGRVRSRNLDL